MSDGQRERRRVTTVRKLHVTTYHGESAVNYAEWAAALHRMKCDLYHIERRRPVGTAVGGWVSENEGWCVGAFDSEARINTAAALFANDARGNLQVLAVLVSEHEREKLEWFFRQVYSAAAVWDNPSQLLVTLLSMLSELANTKEGEFPWQREDTQSTERQEDGQDEEK